MSRFGEVVRGAAKQPIEAIQGVVAFALFFFGLYLASPWYVSSTNTAIGQAFQENVVQQLFIGLGLFSIPALPILLSFFFARFNTAEWYARSNFWMFFGLLFLTLLRLIVIGPVPATWVISLALAFVIGICSLYWKAKTK